MAKSSTRKKVKSEPRRPVRRIVRWVSRGLAACFALVLALVLLFAVVNPPTTFYMWQEGQRLGGVKQEWVDWADIAPVMPRSVVAAEDANFCLHWGFDMGAIRAAIDAGGNRGASTLTQQVVKNVFLWQGRTYLRKALEAMITPLVEVIWSKQRILEVYLNVAEFGEGVFGIKAAAARDFAVEPAALTAQQAARLAVVLPDPKDRSAEKPSRFLRKRAASVLDGAETIRRDGRSACFEP
ncbi:monofunctional biosynthetic peptidoglycan transglycosylase [Pseudorhodobacter sp.]|uniref:monofunctional biosynthetic peptidoglycan transglycosylase n=1 Tax=Pseudorhodobacter sp. TaxID=1934400 RepID=UPI00264A24B5|nr:monofunctional biosynthetic peptidoglycan transglycosylase [Pseudorhodobacter sp.]MDN5788878.1 monofunctional biosynthetic peptidoglycan transglycosylase [Pseudorhodobacter sp.]